MVEAKFAGGLKVPLSVQSLQGLGLTHFQSESGAPDWN
jgi:hypothetical protein